MLDANTGQNALAQVKAFDDALGLTGLVLTKLDGTAKGGVVCAIAHARSKDPGEAGAAPLRRRRRRHRRPAPLRRARLRRGAGWLASPPVAKRYPGGQEALKSVSFSIERGRARVRHRPLGRRQVDAAQAHPGDRAAELGLGDRQRPERRRAQARRRFPTCGATSASCSRTRSCSTTARVYDNVMLPLAFSAHAAEGSGAARARRARQGRPARAREGEPDPALRRRAAAPRHRARGRQPARRSCSPTSRRRTSTRSRRAASSTSSSSFNQVGVTVLIATHDQGARRALRQAACCALEAGRVAMNAWLRQHRAGRSRAALRRAGRPERARHRRRARAARGRLCAAGEPARASPGASRSSRRSRVFLARREARRRGRARRDAEARRARIAKCASCRASRR